MYLSVYINKDIISLIKSYEEEEILFKTNSYPKSIGSKGKDLCIRLFKCQIFVTFSSTNFVYPCLHDLQDDRRLISYSIMSQLYIP